MNVCSQVVQRWRRAADGLRDVSAADVKARLQQAQENQEGASQGEGKGERGRGRRAGDH